MVSGMEPQTGRSPEARSRRGPELRLLIAGPHGPLRETVKRLIELYEGCSVVAEASSGEETVAKVAELRPDLTILDLNLPGGLAVLGCLAGQFRGVKLAVLLSEYTEAYRAAVQARGAFACIDKEHLEEHLAWAIGRARSEE